MAFVLDRRTSYRDGNIPGGPLDPTKICPGDTFTVTYVERSGQLFATSLRLERPSYNGVVWKTTRCTGTAS
jgi:hypothetical protein